MGVTSKLEKVNPEKIKFASRKQGSAFWNARLHFQQQKMLQIRESIRSVGLLCNPTIRYKPNGDYELVCGEQRLRCVLWLLENDAMCHNDATGKMQPASLVYQQIGCKVLYDCSDKEASKRSVAENLNREDVTEIDLMQYCLDLCELKNEKGENLYTRDDVQELLDRSATWVSQTMSLFELTDRAKEMLASGVLPRTVALNLLKVKPHLVDRVLDRAEMQAKIANEDDKERCARLVERFEAEFEQAEDSVAAMELLGDRAGVREARRVRASIDKKLSDAMSRNQTAQLREPRLSADALQVATDSIPGARKGKSSGLSQKIIRAMLCDLGELLDKNEPIKHPQSGVCYGLMDLKLVQKVLEMVTGKRTERDTLALVANHYVEEKFPPWATTMPDSTAA